MILYTICNSCKNTIKLPFSEFSRADIAMKKGDFIELRCNKCYNKDKYHLNNIMAKKSPIAVIISLIIFILGTPLLLYFLGDYFFRTTNLKVIGLLIGIVGIPTIMYNLINKEEQKKVSGFNSFKIKNK
jgi:hypothetical protein